MQNRVRELAGLFFKLGVVGFGGPAAHLAMMEDEVVERRRWMSREDFLDLIAVTNLIPGPNSTEMAIHIGWRRAGLAGLVVAGAAFILPAVLITAGFAWAYSEYGHTPDAQHALRGIQPAVLAIIALAAWRLSRKAMRTAPLATLGIAVAVASLAGVDPIICLVAGAAGGTLWLTLTDRWRTRTIAGCLIGVGLSGATASAATAGVATIGAGVAGASATSASLVKLGLSFLKVGAVLYGSGYVLIAYLQSEIVGHYPFTQQQLVDAIAVGQMTPGPILSTATFVGYQIAGPAGAAVATLGIFLPSFVFVLLVNPLAPRMRRSPVFARLLDAAAATSMGLLLAVTIQLTDGVLVDWDQLRDGGGPAAFDWRGWLILAAAAIALWRYRVSAAVLVVVAAAVGWILY